MPEEAKAPSPASQVPQVYRDLGNGFKQLGGLSPGSELPKRPPHPTQHYLDLIKQQASNPKGDK